MVDYNGVIYTYAQNYQGDILGLLDNTGAAVVTYSYDAWGRLLATGGTLASTLGKLNPFRYRGYVYDEETGLYYLRSRYYNPEWGRFISSDAVLGKVGAVGTHNLFAYCLNNPVNRIDPDGNTSGVLENPGYGKEILDGLKNLGGTLGGILGGALGGVTGFIGASALFLLAKYAGRLTDAMSKALESIKDTKYSGPAYYFAIAFFDDSPTPLGEALTFDQMVAALNVIDDPLADIMSYADYLGYLRAYGADNVKAVGVLTEYESDAIKLAAAVAITRQAYDDPDPREDQKLSHFNVNEGPLAGIHFWSYQR